MEFAAQPPGATLNFAGIWFRMDAPLAALLEFEMLDRIGDVTELSIDARVVQTFVEQSARRAYERPARNILFVAGLLPNEDDPGVR